MKLIDEVSLEIGFEKIGELRFQKYSSI